MSYNTKTNMYSQWTSAAHYGHVCPVYKHVKRCSFHQAHLVMRTVLSSKHKVSSGCVVWMQKFLLSPRIFPSSASSHSFQNAKESQGITESQNQLLKTSEIIQYNLGPNIMMSPGSECHIQPFLTSLCCLSG